MVKKLLRFYQNDQEFYVTTLSFEEISKTYKVVSYEDDRKYGYQRMPNPSHYDKIALAFKNGKQPSFPTAILYAVDESDISDKFKNCEYDFDSNQLKFRVVDGQHRIKGLEKAIELYPTEEEKIKKMEFAVIIMVIKDNEHHKEVSAFCDVNLKAKPIKKDLALLAKYRVNRIEKVNPEKSKENTMYEIGIAIVSLLSEDKNIKVWQNAFIFDPAQSQKGIVGMKSFIESIKPLYQQCYRDNLDTEQIDIDIPNKIINDYLSPIWTYLFEKYKECFNDPSLYNEDKEPIYFNNGYSIQKTLGVKVLHKVLNMCIKNTSDSSAAVKLFKQKIDNSMIKSSDWATGERFSSISSEAGYSYLANLIINDAVSEL